MKLCKDCVYAQKLSRYYCTNPSIAKLHYDDGNYWSLAQDMREGECTPDANYFKIKVRQGDLPW